MREGWKYKKLEECCNIDYGTRVVQKKDGGTIYPVYGGGGETFRMDKYNRENCLIIARFAMSKTCVRYVTGKFFLNDSGLSVSAGDEMLQAYLNHLFVWYNDDIYNLGKGAAQRNLDVKAFKNLTIAIPPIHVQESIVSELDKINELIRLKKEQLSDYDKLAQSLFYEMFGNPVDNEKGWVVKKFGEIASFKNGLNFGKNENGYSYKILGVGDFKDNFVVNSSSLEYINLDAELSSDYFLKPEDIIFVRSNGSKELVGRCVSVDCTEPTTYSGFCIRCRLNENSSVLPMYLLYVCKNKSIREYLTQSGRGCNISNVNQKILNSTDLIIPPLSNQELFIRRIELIEQQKAEIQSTIADLETLLASRTQYWFD